MDFNCNTGFSLQRDAVFPPVSPAGFGGRVFSAPFCRFGFGFFGRDFKNFSYFLISLSICSSPITVSKSLKVSQVASLYGRFDHFIKYFRFALFLSFLLAALCVMM